MPADPCNDEAFQAGARWSPLRLFTKTGEGSFGEVFLAWDPNLERQVALKVLHPSRGDRVSPTQAIDAARLLARVRHPNVLTVHGAEWVNGQIGIWTEFIEGGFAPSSSDCDRCVIRIHMDQTAIQAG